jgi:uncharacterized membrane protein
MLTVKKVDPLQPIAWFKQGWRVFLSNPVNWSLMALLFGVMVLVLSVLPFIGGLVLNLLVPILTGGMLLAVSRDAGRQAEIMDLFSVFRDEQKRTQLLIVGALMLGAGLLAAIVSAMFVGDAVKVDELTGMPSFNLGMGALLFLMVVAVVMGMLFIYAPALVMFKGMGALDAVKGSFQGTSANVLPFVVFVLMYAALSFVASIPFMLGFLVLIPVMIGAVYAGYKDIFA